MRHATESVLERRAVARGQARDYGVPRVIDSPVGAGCKVRRGCGGQIGQDRAIEPLLGLRRLGPQEAVLEVQIGATGGLVRRRRLVGVERQRAAARHQELVNACAQVVGVGAAHRR